jgi:hypothetical protein
MKLPFQIHALAAALALTPFAAFAQSTNNMVRIEVRVQSDSDRKDIKGTSADTVTQSKILNIAISGKAKSPETRTGKWTAYGRGMKGNDITVLESGEFKIDLASGAQKIESKKVTTTSTPEHSVVSGSSSRGRSPKAKKVAGEGTKFIGFGVVVKDGDKTVGEYFDPAGLKAEAAK